MTTGRINQVAIRAHLLLLLLKNLFFFFFFYKKKAKKKRVVNINNKRWYDV